MPRHKSPADKVQSSGTKRMKELGRVKVEVWLDAREHALMIAAAGGERKKLAAWIREQAFHAAERKGRTGL